MTAAELSYLDHIIAASDALKGAADDAALPHSTYGVLTDLRHAGELLFQASFAVVDAGSEQGAAAVEAYRWALMKVLEVAAAMPGDGMELLAKGGAGGAEKPTPAGGRRRKGSASTAGAEL